VDFFEGHHGAIKGDEHQTVSYGGSTTSVTAVPDRGYRFVNWTDQNRKVVGTCADFRLSYVTDCKQITANFERR
jgi:hypothetical protein